ncbi:titin homolog [Pectinophora gossypiella]|uniref:titin homolog n=1 Tax=Pectinophora gossypiella TaxID=13191 RepID=UPI00214DF524|nr:titin homolog [Pectinophora gossypiella]
MEFGSSIQGSESQDSDEPAPPGTGGFEDIRHNAPSTSSPLPSSFKGIENAKKRLRAFSIQKKAPLPPVSVVKPVSTGNTTVLIGKLSSVKVTPKVEKLEDEQKKLPKPPKPGARQKLFNESYTEVQKKTLAEIEDMKRKMELVDLGIPLGLVCPSTNAIPAKAMPTKAMPPIKTFLDTAKIDAIIREAKKAKAEGKEFKFDYQKFVPDYDNPFQRKKETEADKAAEKKDEEQPNRRGKSDKDKERRKGDRFDRRYWKDGKDKFRDKDKFREREKRGEHRSKDREDKNKEMQRERDGRSRDRDMKSRDRDDRSKDRDKHKIKDVKNKEREDKGKDRDSKIKDKEYKDRKDREDSTRKDKSRKDAESLDHERDGKETDVNLNDYLVCDSWSLDTEDKNTSSPQVEDKTKTASAKTFLDPLEHLRQSLAKKDSSKPADGPKIKEKLKPVIDSFKFELDPNDENDDDTMLDIFDEDSDLERYSQTKSSKKDLYDSPVQMKFSFDREAKDISNDGMNDDMFLESVINELKQENMSDDEHHDKGLVEYDESPIKSPQEPSVGSVTPELDDSIRLQSQRSDYSDGYRSVDSRKSTESGYKSTESGFRSESSFKPVESAFKEIESVKSKTSKEFSLSIEKELDEAYDNRMSKDVVDSLETWSFVLKICQPLLFRHDKNKCYKETRTAPKVWYTQNPKLCSCVKDRSVVYEELEMCKMNLVDRVYGCDQIPDAPYQVARSWYPRIEQCLVENPKTVDMTTEWDIEERRPEKSKLRRSQTPEKVEEESLDREYQRFMEAVEGWPEVEGPGKDDSRSTTPVRHESRKKKAEDSGREEKKKAKKMKLSSGGWSQESDVEEEKAKPVKPEKVKAKRKRKHSASTISSESLSDDGAKKRKKVAKKKDEKKVKTKAKRKKLEKKMAKKLKEKKKKKKVEKIEVDSDLEEEEEEIKKKDKKLKKKKQQKLKKKTEKKKKRVRSSSSSSSSSSSDSSSETESELDKKAKKKKKKEAEARKKKKEKKKKSKQQSASDSTQSEELFDVNILNNIKTERVTDDEKREKSPVKHREIISVKELHEEFSSKGKVAQVQVKQEVIEEAKNVEVEDLVEERQEEKSLEAIELPKEPEPEMPQTVQETEAELMHKFDLEGNVEEEQFPAEEKIETVEFKEPEIPTPPPRPDESSQCSSQESICSIKDQTYEKDESHLRPSSQNSNYSFNDVMASQVGYKPMEDNLEGYENYDMYEQMAMAYQSDVASQLVSPPSTEVSQRIETVVRARGRGEIKCDWRASDPPAVTSNTRPSRWGLKPGEVNIVLTGADTECGEPETAPPPVYQIQSLANRTDSSIEYDEAYMDMYGASDRLQYGDCFAAPHPQPPQQQSQQQQESQQQETRGRSLDDRINQALRDTVLGDVAKDDTEKDTPEKGILVMKSLSDTRAAKRVSFADGYKPGQDSDVEEPPVKKARAPRRVGCAWPCAAGHPDHVPLWDALPPPPPPPGSPPRPPQRRAVRDLSMAIPNFRPPEPPPGILNFA